MPVPVMQIRIVGMAMAQRGMPVDVHMRLARRISRPMLMLVMGIMAMGMFMQHFLVAVLMLMLLGQMQP